MNKSVVKLASFVLFLFVPSALQAAEHTIKIDSKNKVMTVYKVVVKGVMKIAKGESYDSMTSMKIVNDDDGKTEVAGNIVNITAPVKQGDGTWTDGSYEYYANTSIQGKWYAQAILIYISTDSKQTSFTAAVGFTLP